jgi:hypothetical protein
MSAPDCRFRQAESYDLESMNGAIWPLLLAIALGVLASAIWDGIKLLVRLAWPRRELAVGGVRRLVLPGPEVQLRRVVAALVASLALATFANTLPPAVLPNN